MTLYWLWVFYLFLKTLLPQCSGDVFSITNKNQSILNTYRVALVAYTADWCFFSRQLAPIFADASRNFTEETKNARVLFGRVDCEADGDLCARLRITKYPTIKVHKYGVVMRKEFRQQRTVDALIKFVQDHAAENVTVINANGRSAREVIDEYKASGDTVFGAFPTPNANNSQNRLFEYFKMGAHLERDNCAFIMLENVGDSDSKLYFKDALTSRVEALDLPDSYQFSHVQSWLASKCTPIVRELTFANAEDITEEGLPLLILFYDDPHKDLVINFRDLVASHMTEERKSVNFVTAYGRNFTHPLSHIGKTVGDLPLISIDSFAHMYVHPKHPREIVSNHHHLAQFVRDLHSGKLHREFHYGPDKSTAGNEQGSVPEKHPSEPGSIPKGKTEPPPSVFNKLKPSHLKYTLLHDEL